MTDDDTTQAPAAAQEAPQEATETEQALLTRITELEAENVSLRQGRSLAPKVKQVSDYRSGDLVDVIKDGVWIPGFVNGREPRFGLVYVHTERGPVTVAATDSIRSRTK